MLSGMAPLLVVTGVSGSGIPLTDLEPLAPDEPGITLDLGRGVDQLVGDYLAADKGVLPS